MSTNPATSTANPQTQGNGQPQQTQEQPQTPPEPKRVLFIYDGVRGHVEENPQKQQQITEFFTKHVSEGGAIPAHVGLEMDDQGVLSLSVHGQKPNYVHVGNLPKPKEAVKDFQDVFSGSFVPPQQQSQTGQSQNSGNTPPQNGNPQQQSPNGAPQQQQQQQPPTGSPQQQQQQQPPTGSPQQQVPPQQVQQPAVDPHVLQLMQQINQLQLQQQQLQFQLAHPAVPPPIPVPDDLGTRTLVANLLRNHIPTLNRISGQLQQADQNLMTINIGQLNLAGPHQRTLPELHQNRDAIIALVFQFLEDKTSVLNMQEHLLVVSEAAGALTPDQQAILQYLIPAHPPLGGARPARALVRPNINSSLGDLLAVYTHIETNINQHLRTETQTIQTALQQHLQEPIDFTAQTNELMNAGNQPLLTRLVVMDGEITTALRNKLNTKIQSLQTDTQKLQAAFAYNFNGIVPAAGQPAVPSLANHTRAELLQVPANIVAQFRAYLPVQINQMPQHLQAPVIPIPLLAPQIDPLNRLTPVVDQIINNFKDYLDGLPVGIRGMAPARPNDTFPSLIAQYQALQTALGNELNQKITAEQGRVSPNQARRAAMLQKLATPAAGATLASLLTEVTAAPNPLPPADLARLVQIKTEFDEYLESYSWRKTAYTIAGVAAAALLVYAIYHFSGEISSGTSYVYNGFVDNLVTPITRRIF